MNFRLDHEAYFAARAQFFKPDADLVRTGKEHFSAQAGSVVPHFFWRDEEHFLAEGVGYSAKGDLFGLIVIAYDIHMGCTIG